MTPVKMTGVSEQIRALRDRLGLSQRAFGVLVGISESSAQGQVYRWEQGEYAPTSRYMMRLIELGLLDKNKEDAP